MRGNGAAGPVALVVPKRPTSGRSLEVGCVSIDRKSAPSRFVVWLLKTLKVDGHATGWPLWDNQCGCVMTSTGILFKGRSMRGN